MYPDSHAISHTNTKQIVHEHVNRQLTVGALDGVRYTTSILDGWHSTTCKTFSIRSPDVIAKITGQPVPVSNLTFTNNTFQ